MQPEEKVFWSHRIKETNKKQKIPADILSAKYEQVQKPLPEMSTEGKI